MDRKQVRRAGKIIWKAVLIALNVRFNLQPDKDQAIDERAYRQLINQSNPTLLQLFNAVYDIVYKAAGWDGIQLAIVVEEGLSYGDKLIDWYEA